MLGMMRVARFRVHAIAILVCCNAALERGQASANGDTARAVLTDTAPGPSARFPAKWYPPRSDQVYTFSLQRERPYVATLVTTTNFPDPQSEVVRSLISTTRQMRDGQGRRREETEMPRPDRQGKTIMAHEVTVHDPVSHCDFQWIEPWVVTSNAPAQPLATVTCKPLILRYTNQNIWRDGVVATQQRRRDRFSEYVSEPLGHRSMDGLDAVGTRTTTTRFDNNGAPAGTVVTELWYSPELDELLSMRMTGREGAGPAALPDFQLSQVRRNEPDSSLFYPPAGYRIESTIPDAR